MTTASRKGKKPAAKKAAGRKSDKTAAGLELGEEFFDDGIGVDMFGADVWAQLNTGKEGRELDDYIEDVKASARVAIDQSISILTPWFFSNMPQFYYETTPREEKVRDLHAIITGHIFESKQTLRLWNRDRSKVTFLAPGNEDGIFVDIAADIQGLDVKHGSFFTSNDRLLLIASFFTEEFKKVDLGNPKNKNKLDKAKGLLADEDQAEVEAFLTNLDHDMVIHATHPRLARLFKMYRLSRDREDAVTHLIPRYFHEYARLDVALKKMPISQTLHSVLPILARYGFQLNRCVMATVNQHSDTPISIFTFIIRHETGKTIDAKFVPFLKINKAIKSLRWVDFDHFDRLWIELGDKANYSLNEINFIRAIGTWDQIFLSKLNPYYYSEERIRKTFFRNADILKALVTIFKLRFDPRARDEAKAKAEEDRIHAMLTQDVADRIENDIFMESLNFIKHILKTNYFYGRKTGLSFRMDPAALNPDHYPYQPFGFFFMIGRGYRGFHVRYRDTARGGLRIVMPHDATQYEGALAGLFDEVIGLAYAQQLKNKDIPEGGSKAVLLLTPGADRETAALGAVDSILNLITADEKGRLDPSIIDNYGREEFIYLGPDENCTNQLIEAFVRQAQRQGYRFPNAFMSSKPGAGINHKEFGVTSEGVNVFLDNLLAELGVDPAKDAFTVKMTGGPDGDVAGNELKILHREYGKCAKVVAIADGLGAAYDPSGLDWKELLRLVGESRSIREFNPKKLSGAEGAFVIPAQTTEQIRTRNSLNATAKADIFIPAGGRPYTVNTGNWRMFLDENEKPTVRGVVEGANIFFTENARTHLQDQGVLMFKDSSANKCGVICSSFEIISSLILTPEEFMAIKDVYVAQVVEKLRHKADLEAKLLLREYHERGKKINLVELSKVVSHVINRVTDLVSMDLDRLSDDELQSDLCRHIILDYVPDVLAEKYPDRVLHQIPRSYRQAIISADTASRLVYKEGAAFFETLADEDVVRTVEIYVEKEQQMLQLLHDVAKADLKHKDEVLKILELAGARTLTLLKRKLS